jgi:hypothetical protein
LDGLLVNAAPATVVTSMVMVATIESVEVSIPVVERSDVLRARGTDISHGCEINATISARV